MVYPTITDNFDLDTWNANFAEVSTNLNELVEDKVIYTPPNKILAMPTKPTYSGNVITVYAGTKVSIPNGRNADGTVKNTILTLANNVTQIMGTNRLYTVLLFANSGLSQHYASNYLYIETLSDRPTTVAAISRYYCYCIETNLWYTTSGSLTASWSVSYMCPLGTANMTTVVTSLKIDDVYNAGHEVDKINTKTSYTPTPSNLGTITTHLAMVKNGVARYKLQANTTEWVGGTAYNICSLSLPYRPSVVVKKEIAIKGTSPLTYARFTIDTNGGVSIKPWTSISMQEIEVDETYIL